MPILNAGTLSDFTTANATNVTLTAEDGRTVVSVLASASGGPMTVTVEVSTDGTNWYERSAVFASDVSDGASEAESFQTGAEYVRARGDANVGRLEVAAKGA